MKNELSNEIKTTSTEKRAVIGGGFNEYQVTRTNAFRGEILGTELTEAHAIQIEQCDHIESADSDGIEITPGFWVKKSLVKWLHFQRDQFGVSTVCRVEFARPL